MSAGGKAGGGEQCRGSLSLGWGKAEQAQQCLARLKPFPFLAGTVGGLGSREQQQGKETPVAPSGRHAGPLPAPKRLAVTDCGEIKSAGSRRCSGAGNTGSGAACTI